MIAGYIPASPACWPAHQGSVGDVPGQPGDRTCGLGEIDGAIFQPPLNLL